MRDPLGLYEEKVTSNHYSASSIESVIGLESFREACQAEQQNKIVVKQLNRENPSLWSSPQSRFCSVPYVQSTIPVVNSRIPPLHQECSLMIIPPSLPPPPPPPPPPPLHPSLLMSGLDVTDADLEAELMALEGKSPAKGGKKSSKSGMMSMDELDKVMASAGKIGGEDDDDEEEEGRGWDGMGWDGGREGRGGSGRDGIGEDVLGKAK